MTLPQTAAEVAPDIWEITLPTGFSPPSVNCVLLRGDPLTLYDCGLDSPAAVAALEDGLARAGVRPRDIEVLVLSHFHVDHAGWAAPLRDMSGCRVIAHENTARWLAPGAMERRGEAALRMLTGAGAPAAVADQSAALLRWLWSFGHPVHVDEYVADGQQLRLGSRDWTTVHTPGHAYGLISLWQPDLRLLLASDHIIRDVSSNAIIDPLHPDDPAPVRSLPLYRAALQRVAELPVQTVLSGHGPPVNEVGDLVRRRLRQQDDRAAKLYEWLRAGRASVWELTGRLFPRLQPTSAYLAVSEVLGHLFLLEDRGLARSVEGLWTIDSERNE